MLSSGFALLCWKECYHLHWFIIAWFQKLIHTQPKIPRGRSQRRTFCKKIKNQTGISWVVGAGGKVQLKNTLRGGIWTWTHSHYFVSLKPGTVLGWECRGFPPLRLSLLFCIRFKNLFTSPVCYTIFSSVTPPKKNPGSKPKTITVIYT